MTLIISSWWFPETTSHGYPRTARRTKQSQVLSEIMDYCYHHGCSVIVFEDPDIIKTRRFTKNSTANRKITRWTKREASQMFVLKALRYGLKPFFVNPAYTSKLVEPIAKDLGLDKHTTSAYILALEYLGLRPKETHQNLQNLKRPTEKKQLPTLVDLGSIVYSALQLITDTPIHHYPRHSNHL